MSLDSTEVSRCLDKKFRIVGFEVPDLLVLLLTFGTLKVGFTGTGLEAYFVWTPAIVAAIAIRVVKRGKPDNYIQHMGRFYFQPRTWSAFLSPTKWSNPPNLNQAKSYRRNEH